MSPCPPPHSLFYYCNIVILLAYFLFKKSTYLHRSFENKHNYFNSKRHQYQAVQSDKHTNLYNFLKVMQLYRSTEVVGD